MYGYSGQTTICSLHWRNRGLSPITWNTFETDGQLTLSDIQNKAEYKAKSASVNVGTSLSFDGALKPGGTSAGFGKEGDKAESMTLAAISGIAGNTAARTGDKETGIAKIFDQEKVEKEIAAQTKITQQFGQLASKAVGDYAETKLKEAQTLRAQGREQEAKDLESQWGANGTLRLAAHTVIGGLSGGVSGAAGAAAGTLTAPLVAEVLAEAGVDTNLGKVITALASTAVGAAAGGTAGGSAALNEVANNYLDHRKPNAATLSEKERYERAAEECRSGNDSACTAQREMAAQSIRRDQLLADACKVDQLQCNALTREAIAMGNLVYGRFGELVWANSPDKTFPLNVATIGPAQSSPVYASAWHYQQAGNLAEGVALAAPGAAGARVIGGVSALGFGLGAGFDAVGQYAQNGSVRLEQSGVAGITGAIGLPVAARGGVYLVPLTGATVAAANTTFNNWYYNEATNIWVAAGLGAGFAAAAPYVGQAVTGGTNRLLGNPMMHIPASGPVQPMQIYRNAEFWAAVPRQAGTVASHTVGSLPSFIPLDNGKSGIRP